MFAWMLLLPFAVGFTSFFGVMIFKKIKQNPYHEINIIDAGPLGTTEEVASIMSQAFPLEELVKSWQKTPEELQRVLMEVCPPSQDEKISLAYQTFKNRTNTDFLHPCGLSGMADEHWTAAVTH